MRLSSTRVGRIGVRCPRRLLQESPSSAHRPRRSDTDSPTSTVRNRSVGTPRSRNAFVSSRNEMRVISLFFQRRSARKLLAATSICGSRCNSFSISRRLRAADCSLSWRKSVGSSGALWIETKGRGDSLPPGRQSGRRRTCLAAQKKGGTNHHFRTSEEMEIHLSLVNLPLALSPFRQRKGFFS